jgi:hypothetical protein
VFSGIMLMRVTLSSTTLYVVLLCYCIFGFARTSLENEIFILNRTNVLETTKRRLVDRWEVPTELKIDFMGKHPACIQLSQGYLYTNDKRTLPFSSAGTGQLSAELNGRNISLKCLYMTNINYHVRKKWKPRVREVSNLQIK